MGTLREKIDYLKNTKLQIKQAIIDKGVTIEDAENFRNYANKITEIKSETKLNVFMQTTEPETKEGIWLQDTKQVDKTEVVESYSAGDGEWESLANFHTTIQMYDGVSATFGKDIYMFGSGYAYTEFARYNTEELKFYRILDVDGKDLRQGGAVTIGDYIYLFGGSTNPKNAFKYNPIAKTFTSIASIPVNFSYGIAVPYSTYVYLFFSYSSTNYVYRYSTSSNSYTSMSTAFPFAIQGGVGACVGDEIFIWDNTNAAKYNVSTKEITILSTPPIKTRYSDAIVYGSDVYLFGGSGNTTSAYKYNVSTDTYTKLDDIPFGFASGYCGLVDNSMYLLGGNVNKLAAARYTIPVQEFDDKTIAIAQGAGKYKTQMYANENITGRLLYGFDDVKYNTTANGLDNTIPTYYGNGTEWIKFKN